MTKMSPIPIVTLFFASRLSSRPKIRPEIGVRSLLVTTRVVKSLFAAAIFFSASLASVCLPAPAQASIAAQSQIPSAPALAAGNISGTVLDTNGDVLQGVTVTLINLSGVRVRTVKSGRDGQFAFPSLPPAVYRITVSATGMAPFSSASIALAPGQAIIQPPVRLAVARAITSVTVSGDPRQLSIEQVHIAAQQRVLSVFPNFYSSYDWNAPPMLAKQKFELSFRSVFDPVSFLGVAVVAGAEQYENIFPAYGQGAEGYGKRYGAAMANHVTADLFSKAIYPAIFHQDPRYFYKGNGSFRSRALYAISTAVIARGDNGHWMPNYSNIFGNFTAAALSNLYYPAENRGVSLVFLNALADTGADAGADLVREFILKRFTSHAPKSAAGKPITTP